MTQYNMNSKAYGNMLVASVPHPSTSEEALRRRKQTSNDEAITGCDDFTEENNPVSHPAHYTYGDIETIDMIRSAGYLKGFCLGNAMKYIVRCEHKGNTLEDLEKAAWYLNHLIEDMKAHPDQLNDIK